MTYDDWKLAHPDFRDAPDCDCGPDERCEVCITEDELREERAIERAESSWPLDQ